MLKKNSHEIKIYVISTCRLEFPASVKKNNILLIPLFLLHVQCISTKLVKVDYSSVDKVNQLLTDRIKESHKLDMTMSYDHGKS